ncbi:MAG: hypothetical protein ABIS47_00475 [Acidimicrobiales bacterium]
MRPGFVVAVSLLAASSAVGVAGSADAQAVASITIVPAETDPGSTVVVTNGPTSPCPPPVGTKPTASVDLYALGSATPANRLPYQGAVTAAGTWSVEVALAPDLPPGRYRVQAGCYSDSGLRSGFGPAYDAGGLDLRLHTLPRPTLSDSLGRPGETVQVGSGDARCTPPAGAASPRVRVSLLDAGGATRAEAEGGVEAADGRWSLPLRIPPVDSQASQITAVCLARVGAAAPYARYEGAPFVVETSPSEPPATPPPLGPVPTPITPAPGSATTTTTATGQPPGSLPLTPLAQAIVAEPTYTG